SSSDGDAVAWLTDNSFKVLASNDDATASTTDSHVAATLPGNSNPAIVTYYIIFREYDSQPAHFVVALKGGPAVGSCRVDADCANLLPYVEDGRVSQCNNDTHRCERVKPEEVHCQGFVRNPHHCAAGYTCVPPSGVGVVADV